MTYRNIDALTQDALFAGRIRACCVEQAETYKADARPAFVALAGEEFRGGGLYLTFVRIAAAGPGIADSAGDPIDQTRIADADILAAVQANWDRRRPVLRRRRHPLAPEMETALPRSRKPGPYDQDNFPAAPEPTGEEDVDAEATPSKRSCSAESPPDAV